MGGKFDLVTGALWPVLWAGFLQKGYTMVAFKLDDAGKLIFSHTDRPNVVFSDDAIVRHAVNAAAEYVESKDKSIKRMFRIHNGSILSCLGGIILGTYLTLFLMYLKNPDAFIEMAGLVSK